MVSVAVQYAEDLFLQMLAIIHEYKNAYVTPDFSLFLDKVSGEPFGVGIDDSQVSCWNPSST